MGRKHSEPDARDLKVTKMLYIACLINIASLFGLVFQSRSVFFARYGIAMSANDLNSTVIFFALISVLSLAGGYLVSRFILESASERKWLLTSLVRIGSSMTPTAGGLVAGFLGAGWLIVTLFFLTSAAALIITFPKRTGWNKTSRSSQS